MTLPPSPRMILPPGTHLLRPGSRDFTNDDALPFVDLHAHSPLTGYWCAPEPSSDNAEALAAANAFGKRSAAAYALFVQANGTDVLPLAWIAGSMAAAGPGSIAAQMAFWQHLSRVLWLGCHHVTPTALAADVEAVVAEEAALEAEG